MFKNNSMLINVNNSSIKTYNKKPFCRHVITGMFAQISVIPRILTLRNITPFHSTQLLHSLLHLIIYPRNCHQQCTMPWGTGNNLGQCWRKPHYCLQSSSLWTIFVSGGIKYWRVVSPISEQVSCGVRWDNSTGGWQCPPEELTLKS